MDKKEVSISEEMSEEEMSEEMSGNEMSGNEMSGEVMSTEEIFKKEISKKCPKKENPNKEKKTLRILPITEEGGLNSYCRMEKLLLEVTKTGAKLSAYNTPDNVKVELNQLVIQLGNNRDDYRGTAYNLLLGTLRYFPGLASIVIYNARFIYSKVKGLRQRQAKLMAMGAVLRSGAASTRPAMVRSLVAEVLCLREKSHYDTVDTFFVLSALAEPSTVAAVSSVILTGLGEELNKPIKQLRLTQLWFRLVLGQKMLTANLKVPEWLKLTFAPDQVKEYGTVIFPKSHKLHTSHPFFNCFIPTLAAYDTWRRGLKTNIPKKDTVSVFFDSTVLPTISRSVGQVREKATLKIAYSLLMDIVSCPEVPLEVSECVMLWLSGGGMPCITPVMRQQMVEILLEKMNSVQNLPTKEEKSRALLSLLQWAVLLPEMLQYLRPKLQHLSSDAAHSFVEKLIKMEWKMLTESEASMFCRLVSLSQCTGTEHLEWRLKVTTSIAKRALCMKHTDNDQHEEQDKDQYKNDKEEKGNNDDDDEETGEYKDEDGVDSENEETSATDPPPYQADMQRVTNRDLFLRFLSHASHDRSTCCEVLVEGYSAILQLLKEDPSLLDMHQAQMDAWRTLADKMERLRGMTTQEFTFKKTFEVLLSIAAYDFLDRPSDFPVIYDDLLVCLEEAQQQDKSISEEHWTVRLVKGVLLPLATQGILWCRPVLYLAGRELSGYATIDCLVPLVDVLINDDALDEEEVEEEMEVDQQQDRDDSDADDLGEADNDDDADSDNSDNSDGDNDADSDDSDSDNDTDSDENDSDGEDNDEDLGRDGENKLEAMRSALLTAMATTGMTAAGAVDPEDMDAVPQEQLDRLDRQLGAVFSQFINKRKRARNHKISKQATQIMEIRNRLLDVAEGIVCGSASPSLVLHGVLLPLLQALNTHRSRIMRPFANRIRQVLRCVKSAKKYEGDDIMSCQQLLEVLEEVFTLAPTVVESYYGAVAVLRYARLHPETGDSIQHAYQQHVTDMLAAGKVASQIITEPLSMELPGLRLHVTRTIVTTLFRATADTAVATNDFRHKLLTLLNEVLGKLLSAATQLGEEERQIVGTIVSNIAKYLDECEVPNKRQLQPMSMLLKLIKKNPSSCACVDWGSLRTCITAFKTRVVGVISKGVRKDVDRLATITQMAVKDSNKPSKEEIEALKIRTTKKNELKQQRKRTRKSKLEERQKKLVNRKKAPQSMFGSDHGHIDDDDADSEAEMTKHEDKLRANQKKSDDIRKKKALKNRIKKVRNKEAKRIKKEANQIKRELLKKIENDPAGAQQLTNGVDNPPIPAIGNKRSASNNTELQQRRKRARQELQALNSKLDAPLTVGIFSKSKLCDV